MIIFPNPTSDDVSIHFSTKTSGKVEVNLYDLHQRLIISNQNPSDAKYFTNLNYNSKAGKYEIKIQGLSRKKLIGSYIINIKAPGLNISKHIIIK